MHLWQSGVLTDIARVQHLLYRCANRMTIPGQVCASDSGWNKCFRDALADRAYIRANQFGNLYIRPLSHLLMWHDILHYNAYTVLKLRGRGGLAPVLLWALKFSSEPRSKGLALATLHRVSKTSHIWLAIGLTYYVNRFWHFWQKCYWWSKHWNDALLRHIKWLVLLHYLVKRGNTKIAFFIQMLY